MILRTLWAGVAAFVPLVVVANVAIEAVPHARGIAFLPSLRYAMTVPACVASAVGAALAYSWLLARVAHPRWALGVALLVLAVVTLALMATLGARGLVRATAPAIAFGAATVALLIPRFAERPPGLAGTAAIA